MIWALQGDGETRFYRRGRPVDEAAARASTEVLALGSGEGVAIPWTDLLPLLWPRETPPPPANPAEGETLLKRAVARAQKAPTGLKLAWSLFLHGHPLSLWLEEAYRWPLDAGAEGDQAWKPLPGHGVRRSPPGAERVRSVKEAFSPHGPLARLLPQFEGRPGQEAMAEAVEETLREGGILLVEAGTGSGKSLAYLVPALLRGGDGRTVVATRTLQLQEQLLGKDLPVALALSGPGKKGVLLKGYANYLCLKRWNELLEGGFPPQAGVFLAQVASWLHVTQDGDLGELPFASFPLPLGIEPHACGRRACPFFEGCFVFKARQEAESAHVVVVNHALLLADARRGGDLLPPFDVLIVDEAHHLEEAAAQHLGGTFAGDVWRRHLQEMASLPWPPQWAEEAGEILTSAREALEAFLQAVRRWGGDEGEKRWRGEDPQVEEAGERLARHLEGVLGLLSRCQEEGEMAFPAGSWHQLVEEGIRHLLGWLDAPSGWVSFWEGRGKTDILQLSPLEVGEILKEQLLSRVEAAVFTSATLSVAGNLAPYAQRLGLSRWRELKVPSPFRYREQALILVPTDLPAGHGPDLYPWDELAPFLGRLAELTRGRALFLFTSYRALKACRQALDRLGLKVTFLSQGEDGSRAELLAALRKGEEVVLLGTQTFWEGVDLPGDLLRLVVVDRIPFPRPNLPRLEAQKEALLARGENWFFPLHVVPAATLLQQAFGRLIRTAQDQGLFVLLDRRLLVQSYGPILLESLPDASFLQGPRQELLDAAAGFLSGRIPFTRFQSVQEAAARLREGRT
ncbi:MAG: hypothetical protein KM310_00900 [Clostridiales bacterium]|nr:hypothetical protein [Clostridiales bacterium]